MGQFVKYVNQIVKYSVTFSESQLKFNLDYSQIFVTPMKNIKLSNKSQNHKDRRPRRRILVFDTLQCISLCVLCGL